MRRRRPPGAQTLPQDLRLVRGSQDGLQPSQLPGLGTLEKCTTCTTVVGGPAPGPSGVANAPDALRSSSVTRCHCHSLGSPQIHGSLQIQAKTPPQRRRKLCCHTVTRTQPQLAQKPSVALTALSIIPSVLSRRDRRRRGGRSGKEP